MSTVAATFCATLVDEWVRGRCGAAFIAPGSRSTPLALALQARSSELPLHLFHDERSAGFAALGHAEASGRPSILLCTSGTAAAHFYAAVIEADLSSIPLIVCTADRPPELRDVGAPQTIDQNRLFGHAPRFYAEPGVPDQAMQASWRSLGSRLVAESLGAAESSGRAGPVHANLAFRDPLDAAPGPLPAGRAGDRPWHRNVTAAPVGEAVPSPENIRVPATELRSAEPPSAELLAAISEPDGVIVAGRSVVDPSLILELAQLLGWPVLADHRSGCRAPGDAVAHFDSLLRTERLADPLPTTVIRFGEAQASKVLGQWLDRATGTTIAVQPGARWIDPGHRTELMVDHDEVVRLVRHLRGVQHLDGERPLDGNRRVGDQPNASDRANEQGSERTTGRDRWLAADDLAAKAIEETLTGSSQATEPFVARSTLNDVPAGGAMVVASSMPIRDVEWYGANRNDITVYANRGANGIDGVIATGIGVAYSGVPTTVLIGDVAFLHDASSLTALADRPIDLSIVVIDNDGGGIFSFLPQASSVAPEAFETLYGTPHGTDLVGLAQAHRLPASVWDRSAPLAARPGSGLAVTVVHTGSRADNVAVHEQLHQAVAAAIGDL